MRPQPFDDPYLTIHAGLPLDRPDLEAALRRLTASGWNAMLRGMKTHLDRQGRHQRVRHVRVSDGDTRLVWEVGEEAGPARAPVVRALLAVARRFRDRGSQGIHPTIVMARVDPVVKLVHRNPGAVPAVDTLDTAGAAVPAVNPPGEEGVVQSADPRFRSVESLAARLAREDADGPCPRHAIVSWVRGTEDGARVTHYYLQSRYAPEAPLLEAWLASRADAGRAISRIHEGRLREALRTLPGTAAVTDLSGRRRGRE